MMNPEVDVTSPTWRGIVIWAKEIMASYTDQLVTGCVSLREEDELRGRIRQLNDIIGLPGRKEKNFGGREEF